MNSIWTTSALIFSILTITAASYAQNAAQTVVATVGEKKITLEEFNKRYDEVKDKTLNPPTKELFLEDLVRYEIGVQEAQKKNIQTDPIVAERIRQELYKGLIEKDLGDAISKIDVKESEMKDYYKLNPEVRTSHILIEVKPGANDKDRAAAKKRAEEIYSEVRKSKRPFEELVNLYTDATESKATGGDVGFQTPLTVVPEYYRVAEKMKVGEIKGLIETKLGFHIIKLTAKNSYEQAVKQRIRAAVFDEKRKKLFDDYFAKLKSKYQVKLSKSAL